MGNSDCRRRANFRDSEIIRILMSDEHAPFSIRFTIARVAA
jgi:hypothetical protein